MSKVTELQRRGDAFIQVADKLVPGVREHLPRWGHKIIEGYERVPAPIKIGAELLVIPWLIAEVARHHARTQAIRNLDWNEVATEVSSVVKEYNQSAQENGRLDSTYAKALRNGNELRKAENRGKIFDDTLALLDDEKFRSKKQISNEALEAIASASIKNSVSDSVDTVSGLLAHIPHAEGYLEGVDQEVTDYAAGAAQMGHGILEQLNQTHGTNTAKAAEILNRGLASVLKGRERGKEDAIKATAATTKDLLVKAFGHDIASPATEGENKTRQAKMYELMQALESAKILKKSGGSRRNKVYSEQDVQEVEDAVRVYALEHDNLLSENTRKSAGITEVMVVLGATLARRYNEAMAAKQPATTPAN